MRLLKLCFLLAVWLLCLQPLAAQAEVTADPLGFAIFFEDEPVENEIVLSNTGDEAVGFDVKFRSVRREQEEGDGRLGPQRDEPGETLAELRLEHLGSLGFGWDAENSIMYVCHNGSDGSEPRITGYEWNGEEIGEVTVDFVTANIPANMNVELAYFAGILYTFYWGQTIIYRYDVEGNQLESIVREWVNPNGALIYGSGLAVDPEAGFLYMSGIIAMDAGPCQIKVYDINDDYAQVGLMIGFADLGENHNTDVRNRLNWVPEHTDGHLWIYQRDPAGNEGAGPFWPPYHAWQVNVIPGEDIDWNWEVVQHFEVQSDAWSNGIGHDGENLWIGTRADAQVTARIVDDGVIEQAWLTVDPMEGEIAAGEELTLTATADAGDREPGVYELELRLRLTDPDQPEIRMSVFMSFETGTGDITGQIIDPTLNDGEPIEGLRVDLAGYRMTRFTDEEGRFAFEWLPLDDYVLTVNAEGYLPLTAEVTIEQGNEQVDLALELEHSEFTPSIEDVFEALAPDDEVEVAFIGRNGGNGPLNYTTERHLAGGADVDPWMPRGSLNLAAPLEDNYLQGVLFIDDYFYVAGQNDRQPLMYVLDRDGNLERTFAQLGPDPRGANDMAWDGDLMWGISGAVTVGFNTDGEEAIRFDSPMALGKNIAWDNINECLWISGTTTDIFAVSREGEPLDTIDATFAGEQLRMYGLDCYPDDPTGHIVYVYCKERDTDRTMVMKANPENEEIQFVTYLDHEAGGSPTGIHITNQYDIYSWVLVAVANNPPADGGDRVDVWQVDARRDWFLINPEAGRIDPGGEQEFIITLNADDMAPEEYQGEIVFTHDGRGGHTVIPVHLSVREGQVQSSRTLQLIRGWNMVSVNLQPEPADDVRALMRELVDDNNLLLLKDGAGRFYNPEFDFTNIPGWDVAQGYLMKVDHDGALTLSGLTALADSPIALVDGWQMIAYYPRIPVDAMVALSGIEEQLILAKDGAGRFYNPEWGFSNMGDMMEGQGYQLKMDGDCELIYRLSPQDERVVITPGDASQKPLLVAALPEHANTGCNMSLLVTAAEGLTGEIGVYVGDALVGSGILTGGFCGVAVWGDDHTTTTLDGATAGQELRVEFNSVQESLTILEGRMQYTTDAFTVIRLGAAVVPAEFGLTGAYPNPFNGTVRLGYSLLESGFVNLSIYDLNGRLVDVVVSADLRAGAHSIQWSAEYLPSGLYIARLESGSRTAMTKLMLVK